MFSSLSLYSYRVSKLHSSIILPTHTRLFVFLFPKKKGLFVFLIHSSIIIVSIDEGLEVIHPQASHECFTRVLPTTQVTLQAQHRNIMNVLSDDSLHSFSSWKEMLSSILNGRRFVLCVGLIQSIMSEIGNKRKKIERKKGNACMGGRRPAPCAAYMAVSSYWLPRAQ